MKHMLLGGKGTRALIEKGVGFPADVCSPLVQQSGHSLQHGKDGDLDILRSPAPDVPAHQAIPCPPEAHMLARHRQVWQNLLISWQCLMTTSLGREDLPFSPGTRKRKLSPCGLRCGRDHILMTYAQHRF